MKFKTYNTEGEIANKLYELSKDMDYMDYMDYKEVVLADIENALIDIRKKAEDEQQPEYYRTFYRILDML